MKMSTVPLFDGSLCLRPCVDADAAALATAASQSAESVGRWLSWCHASFDLDEATHFVTRAQEDWHAGTGPYDLVVDVSGDFAGCVRLRYVSREDAVGNLGYWIRTDLQGRGLALRAARLAARFAFDTLAMHRLEIVTAEHNPASRRVAEKLGARFECLARNRIMDQEEPTTAAVYALIPGDEIPQS